MRYRLHSHFFKFTFAHNKYLVSSLEVILPARYLFVYSYTCTSVYIVSPHRAELIGMSDVRSIVPFVYIGYSHRFTLPQYHILYAYKHDI